MATLLCDGLKGFLPVLIAQKAGIQGVALLGTGFIAISGHIFPIWLKFRGGKGVATALGVFWGLSLPLGVFTTLVWLIITRFLKISSLSALAAFALAPLFAAFFISKPLGIFCISVMALIFWTHRSNIHRLLSGKEDQIRVAAN